MRNAIARVFLLMLLVTLSLQALNQEADQAIRDAIKAAVLDGLATVDNYVLTNYWYYLRGADKVSFNVSVLPTKLNYIRIYQNLGSFYRVNCDIDKITWKPSLNNFVKVLTSPNLTALLKPSISIVDTQSKVQDLTDQISITAADLANSANTTQPAIPSQQSELQVIGGSNSSSQGVVVLSASNQPPKGDPTPNLTSNGPS